MSRKDFEHSIERKVDIVLPFDAKAASQAAKLGQPLAKVTKSAKLTQPLNQLLDARPSSRPAPKMRAEPAAPKGGGSLLGKLGNFKSLVAKKPKEASAGGLTAGPGSRRDQGGEMPSVNLILLVAGAAGALLLLFAALSGPATGKLVARRLEVAARAAQPLDGRGRPGADASASSPSGRARATASPSASSPIRPCSSCG